ncbi:MAG: response regulator [Lentimicrobium sp.]
MEAQHVIKILFVEDNEFDLHLAERELHTAGLIYTSIWVEKKVDFEREVLAYAPDIVISDYFLPDFNGLDVLEKVLGSYPEIPVIITTGSINEETAVKCMKAGAADYVLKDQLKRLPYSVKEVLNKSAIRKEKALAENALKESEARFSSLLNNISNIAVQGYSADGKVKYWNKASEQLYGYKTEEALGRTLFDLIIPQEMTEVVSTTIREMEETGIAHPAEELKLKRKDGSLVNVYSSHSINELPGGEKEFYCIDIDLTKRISVEKALIDSENKYRNLVENSPVGIYQSTPEGQLLFGNQALVKLLNYNSQQELISGGTVNIFLTPEHGSELLKIISSDRIISDFETVFVTKHGQKKDVIIGASLENNRITGMVLDISERKATENELLKAKEKAEESDRLKSSFLSNLSHEVRTPMNGIVGFAELLLDRSLDEESRQEYVETIMVNSNSLLKIISDIIEISKIKTELLSINYREFSLNGMIRELKNHFQELAVKKGIDFSFSEFNPGEKVLITSDEPKIKLILTHLLDNAFKFTETGSVLGNCRLNDSFLEFSVTDTGIGISNEYVEVIFEPFRQIEDSFNRKFGGNGLGLAISKAYVELLGGKISLQPNSPAGSVFTFNLPVKIKTSDISRCLEIPDYSQCTFLIAEDEPTNYVYLKKLLMPSGASLLHAQTGRQALEIIDSHPKINLVFMDIKMPDIDGLEATRLIKQKYPGLPVIATTAYAMNGDRELCLESGCDGYIPKPIRSAELIRSIKKLIVRGC